MENLKMKKIIRYLSLGGGRQSTVLAVLASEGLLEAEFAIFSDPGSEMPQTYKYLIKYLIPYCEARHFPIHWLKPNGEYIKRENIYDYYYERKTLPYRVNRSCTGNWKIRPIQRFCLQKYPDSNFISYLGFTMDEVHRMKDSTHKRFTNEYPLIDMRIWNKDLKKMYKERNLPYPVKSGCFFCPFNRKAEWKNILYNYPNLFEKAIQLEENAKGPYGLNSQEISLRKIRESKSQNLYEILNVAQDSECGSNCFT